MIIIVVGDKLVTHCFCVLHCHYNHSFFFERPSILHTDWLSITMNKNSWKFKDPNLMWLGNLGHNGRNIEDAILVR